MLALVETLTTKKKNMKKTNFNLRKSFYKILICMIICNILIFINKNVLNKLLSNKKIILIKNQLLLFIKKIFYFIKNNIFFVLLNFLVIIYCSIIFQKKELIECIYLDIDYMFFSFIISNFKKKPLIKKILYKLKKIFKYLLYYFCVFFLIKMKQIFFFVKDLFKLILLLILLIWY